MVNIVRVALLSMKPELTSFANICLYYVMYAFLQLDGNDTQSDLSIEMEKVRNFY